MKHPCNLRAIAQEMKAAQDEVRQIAPFTSRLSGFDDAVAYDVGHLIHQARIDEGAVPVGRKIGFTNPDMWSLYGVREPMFTTRPSFIFPVHTPSVTSDDFPNRRSSRKS